MYDADYDVYWDIPSGACVDLIYKNHHWGYVSSGGHCGYIEAKYLHECKRSTNKKGEYHELESTV